MSTPFDEPSLKVLDDLDVDLLKVASFDLGNLPFIDRIAKTGKPVVISTGGGDRDQIRSSVELLLDNNVEVAVLHCVSEYPCDFNRLGLDNISLLAKEFPNCVIGSSDHFNGILSGPMAYVKGARVFEKHVTLNRASTRLVPSLEVKLARAPAARPRAARVPPAAGHGGGRWREGGPAGQPRLAQVHKREF